MPTLDELTRLVGELNESEMLEGETLRLEPFRLETDGSYIKITFLNQDLWDNADNNNDDDRNVNDIKKHIKEELGHIVNTIKQIDLDKLLNV